MVQSLILDQKLNTSLYSLYNKNNQNQVLCKANSQKILIISFYKCVRYKLIANYMIDKCVLFHSVSVNFFILKNVFDLPLLLLR